MQIRQRFGGIVFQAVTDHDIAQVFSRTGDMHHGPRLRRCNGNHVGRLHQPFVSDADALSVQNGTDSLSCDLLRMGDPVGIRRPAVSFTDRSGDGMIGIHLAVSGDFNQFVLRHSGGIHTADTEFASGQGTRLIQHYGICFRQHFQIIAALDQNTGTGCAADSAKKAEGNGYYESAGTGHHQENQSAVDPLRPLSHKQRRDHGKKDRHDHYAGCIPASEFGNKILRFCLAGRCVFHQLQNLRYGGLIVGLDHTDAQKSRLIDASAGHAVPCPHGSGNGFACQSRGVKKGITLRNHAVQGNLLPRLHHDHRAYGHLCGIQLGDDTVRFHIGVFGADIHQCRNRAAGAGHSTALEKLADLIKQHHGHAFLITPGGESTHGGQCHQKILIKHLSVSDIHRGTPQNIPSDNGIGDQEHSQFPPTVRGHKEGGGKQYRCYKNTDQYLFLFSRHRITAPPGIRNPPGGCTLSLP